MYRFERRREWMHALLSGLQGLGGASPFVSGALGLWVFSAAVCAMSAPDGKSGKAYQWLYRFSHLLAANLDRVDVIGNPDEDAATARQHK
jgi:hypothetical protein